MAVNTIKVRVLDIDFDNVTMDEALDIGEKLMDEPGFKYVVTPNPEICYLSRKDEYRALRSRFRTVSA